MMTNRLSIASFKSKIDDLRADVNEINGRFHVTLTDVDAGMTLPVVRIFKDRDAAIAYAETLLN